jgi:hypothetical protein
MNEYNLTEEEMRDMVNYEITKAYSKMQEDEKRITSYNYHLYSDLLSFVLSEFLTKKDIHYKYKVCCVDKKILNYIGRSMSLNLRSSSSPYWNQIRKQSYNFRGVYLAETDQAYVNGNYDEIEIRQDDDYNCMLIQLDKLDFYHKPLIVDYYIKDMTYEQLNKKYGIALRHLKTAIEEGLNIIKTECKKEQNI